MTIPIESNATPDEPALNITMRLLGEAMLRLRGNVRLKDAAGALGVTRQALLELEGLTCPDCKGLGTAFNSTDRCPMCYGHRKIYRANPTAARMARIGEVYGVVWEIVPTFKPDDALHGQVVFRDAPGLSHFLTEANAEDGAG